MRNPTEAIERHDPLNDDLDELEAAIEAIIARGGEAPLRARLARLLKIGGATAGEPPPTVPHRARRRQLSARAPNRGSQQ